MKQEMIYLDNAATTKVDDSVIKKVIKSMKENFGNPSSQHQLGNSSSEEMERARKEIAKFINAEPEEIFFTSGATESNNLALTGLAIHPSNSEKKHIITSKIEHPSILETCKQLEKWGYKIDYLSVNEEGIVDPKELENKLTDQTLVVSIMHANNEIGTIQPIEKIAEICSKKEVYFHTDAVQTFTKLEINVKKTKISMISASGHKINAPKGIGFLYIQKGTKISPIINGGSQERRIRSGTENTPGIIALAEAIKIKRKIKETEKIRNKLIEEILKIQGARLNGSKKERLSNNINISFYGIEGESLMLLLDKERIEVSTGSACSSHKLSESHVLKAINVPEMYINGSIRITLDTTKNLTAKQIKFVISKIKEKVERLREISPFKLNQKEVKHGG